MPSERVVSPGVSLKERIAALQQRNGSISPPNSSPPAKGAANALQGAGALRDKIARFEVKGGVPVPRGSFGLGAPPVREDAALRRKGELYGNRIVSANAGKFQSPPSGFGSKDGQLSLGTGDGSPVQRKRCISTSVLNSYVPDTIVRSDSFSSTTSSIEESDSILDASLEDHSPIPESPTKLTRRSSVSDVDAKRSSLLLSGPNFNIAQKRDSILFPSSPRRAPATPPSPSRTITQEMTDATVADEPAAAIDAEDSVVAQREELNEAPKEVHVVDAEIDLRHDAHQEIFPVSEDASPNDKVDAISSNTVDEVHHATVAVKLELDDDPPPSVEPELSTSSVDPVTSDIILSPEIADVPQESISIEPTIDEESSEPDNTAPLSTSPPPPLSPSPSSESLHFSRDPTPQPSSPIQDVSMSSVPIPSVEDNTVASTVDISRKDDISPILQSQSMPAIVLSNAPTPQEDEADAKNKSSVTRTTSLRRPRSPNPITLPSVPEQTYTELSLECKTGPKSFKAVVHGKKTHTKPPSPVNHATQVVAPLNLRKGRTSTRRSQGAVPTSPRTPNSPDLSLLVAQAAQLEQRLSGDPEEEIIKEEDGVQEIVVLQEMTMNETTPNLEVDEFGRGPPISPSLQSLISNSSNDSKRRRSKSKSSKNRLPVIDDSGIPPPTPPPKSARWFKTMPASILSRNQSLGSESTGDRHSRASWSSEKSSEDSSAITTPPSPTFDLVTLPLAEEDQYNHPGYRLGGRRSSSISSSSVLSSPKKSPSKKLMSRSSTFMSRMLTRAGKSSSTLALPDDSGSISDVPRASSPSPSHRSSSRSEYGLSTASPQLVPSLPSRPTSTISTSSPASVLSSTIFDAFPEVPQDAPTPPPKSPLHFPRGNNPAPQLVSRSISSVSKKSRVSDPPSWYDEENGVHHSLLL
ncbi:hypothetical protein SCHPADRAFT_83327 [Schizopora paradoxa]|uniref:Uncharacterized protein n=1 Tax=Schizopora paradoxa TaxID=27342 RepID=A0A0H2SBY9_9AGAM|nr:hypothetical protein SCHPADRAFT_83327 [Schizopora paradoxa]